MSIGYALICGICDMRERKIPNALHVTYLIGLLSTLFIIGEDVGASLWNAGILLLIALLLHPFGFIGGGDLKMAIACAARLGFLGTGIAYCIGASIALICVLCKVISAREIPLAMFFGQGMMLVCLLEGRFGWVI